MLKRFKILTGLGIFLILWMAAWYLHGKLVEHRNPLPHSGDARTLQIDANQTFFGPREYIRIHKADWNQEEEPEPLPHP